MYVVDIPVVGTKAEGGGSAAPREVIRLEVLRLPSTTTTTATQLVYQGVLLLAKNNRTHGTKRETSEAPREQRGRRIVSRDTCLSTSVN